MKKRGFDARIALCIAGFILAILLVAADEIFDIPYHLFNAPPTPINWTEIGIESIFILIVGSLTISILWRLNLSKQKRHLKNQRQGSATYYHPWSIWSLY